MDKLIKKTAALSGLNLSEQEIAEFCEDFSDILPLIDAISEFDSEKKQRSSVLDFLQLRSDEPKASGFNLNTKSVPKVIS